MKATVISLLIGYFWGCIVPVIKVTDNPNYLPYEERKEVFY